MSRVSSLIALRQNAGESERPFIIWEPAPFSCTADNLQSCLDAACMVDVFSPNHLELAALFGQSRPVVADIHKIESQALRFLDSGVGPNGKGTVIVRAGEHGCFIIARDISPIWLPPFYRYGLGDKPDAKVVDPTGAGNTSLGHLLRGISRRAVLLRQLVMAPLELPLRWSKWECRRGATMERRNCGTGPTCSRDCMSIGKLLGCLISIVNFIIEGLLRRQVVGIVQTSVV